MYEIEMHVLLQIKPPCSKCCSDWDFDPFFLPYQHTLWQDTRVRCHVKGAGVFVDKDTYVGIVLIQVQSRASPEDLDFPWLRYQPLVAKIGRKLESRVPCFFPVILID